MSLLDKLQHLAFDDLARTEAGSAILLVSESEYAELREFAAHTCTVTLTGPQILDLYEACGGEFTELTSWTVGEREAFVTDDGEQMPAGLYATCTDYPEEGFIGPLGVESEADRPESPPPPPEPPAKRLIHERAPWPFTGKASAADQPSAALDDGFPRFYQPEPVCSQCGKPEPWVFDHGCPESRGGCGRKPRVVDNGSEAP